ncbi:MAG: NAD-dependent epimerase/dehydratase family protein [Spirochaetes bacterium]|nr:NAD-dependent epimerase/dehydratase family protein [Spirochaetota bacterium]
MKNILVTGGLGFLGQYLVAALLKHYPDANIHILAKSKRPIFLPSLQNNSRIQITHDVDILDKSNLDGFFEGIDGVFHVAALVSFGRKDKDRLFQHNIEGTRNILQLCCSHRIKKLVYTSSTAALGYNNSAITPADENFLFDWSKSQKYAYALSKYNSEQLVKEAAAAGLPVLIANISSIYGPGDQKIQSLLSSVYKQKLPAMMPGGLACIDVRDAAEGLVFLYENGQSGNNYILTGGNYTHAQLISTIAESLHVQPPSKIFSMGMAKILGPLISAMESCSSKAPKLTSEVFDMGFKFRYFSTAKIAALGWQPQYSLEQTFADIALEYFAQSQAQKKEQI